MNLFKLQKSSMCGMAHIIKCIPQRWIDELQEQFGIQTRSISMHDQLVAHITAQLGGYTSLRDLVTGMQVHASQLAQIRNGHVPSRNGLAHANATRPAAFMRELFYRVLRWLDKSFPDFFRSGRSCPALPQRLRKLVYAVDSTTIGLAAKAIDWAQKSRSKAGIKVHTVLDVRSMIPRVVNITSARTADAAVAPELCESMGKGDISIFDRGYLAARHLWRLTLRGIRWVTRAKRSSAIRVVGQPMVDLLHPEALGGASETSRKAPRGRRRSRRTASAGPAINVGQLAADADIDDPRGKIPMPRKGDCRILFDAKVILADPKTSQLYPGPMRLVVADVPVRGKMRRLAFLTNYFRWDAETVCAIYRARWTIEAFFKQLKQTLQIKAFLGNGENAVAWQVWASLLTYVLCKFIAWRDRWRGAFSGLVILLRAILWNYFDLAFAVANWHLIRERRPIPRAPPPRQLLLPGLSR